MTGIFNDYTITPQSLNQYNAFRGVVDYTQIGQFDQYETGYQFLVVLGMPAFITKFADSDANFKNIADGFKHMLEYEFKGMDGLPDITSDQMEITDGINSIRMINKVNMDTAITVSMEYYERRGSLITKFSEFYLTGIKDKYTQAKTYHGLIQKGLMKPSFKNEVFTLLYMATDNTMCRLERAVLLCNAQLTKAETSMYNGNRSDINNKAMNIEFTCFPVMNELVDKAASNILKDIVAVKKDTTTVSGLSEDKATKETAILDSTTGVDRNNNPIFGIFTDKASLDSNKSIGAPDDPNKELSSKI